MTLQVTGAALAAAKRLQLNVDLKYMNKLPGYVNVKPLIFPVNWAEEVTYIILTCFTY